MKMLHHLIVAAVLILPSSLSSSESTTDQKRTGPPAHYVIRSSHLRTTLSFLERVTHLRVLRHEENPAPCPITCNGEYAVPWSKTMVGTAPEDEAYALEVTYNYGVDGYERGSALVGFDIYVDDVQDSLGTATDLGYGTDGRGTVVGPDGYRYRLVEKPDGRREPFGVVHFVVADPFATANWYCETFGALQTDSGGGSKTVAFDRETFVYEGEGTVFRFTSGPGGAITQFDGRNALSLPAEQVRSINKMLSETQPERIVHDLQEIDEGDVGLGVLLILIVTDPNGLELCLVSSEAFEPAIRDATDYVGPDYAAREKLVLEYAETVARAKKQKPDGFGWAKEL